MIRSMVSQAFDRADLILTKDRVYPVETGWGPKSQAVAPILQKWNISGDAVVFVDDSPMELAEVRASHGDVECVLFPRDDEQAAYELLKYLRGLFGKSTVTTEDSLRLESLAARPRSSAATRSGSPAPEEFLQQAAGRDNGRFRERPRGPKSSRADQQDQPVQPQRQEVLGSGMGGPRKRDRHVPDCCFVQGQVWPVGKDRGFDGSKEWGQSCPAAVGHELPSFFEADRAPVPGHLFESFAVEEILLDFQATPQRALRTSSRS